MKIVKTKRYILRTTKLKCVDRLRPFQERKKTVKADAKERRKHKMPKAEKKRRIKATSHAKS